MSAYITSVAAFLPNDPVSNEEMETLLGLVRDTPSRIRRIILRNNGIQRRHYALDRATGAFTHTNAALSAEAVRRLDPHPDFTPAEIALLACGTSTPDQLMPGHAAMVHGELKSAPMETVTTSGICMSGLSALKYAFLAVASGHAPNAVAVGSELASSFIRANLFAALRADAAESVEKRPVLAFDADFLRWMLSDGAGAAYLAPRPAGDRLSLRIEWIESVSFAHLLDPCMYAGALKGEDGRLTGWRARGDLGEALAEGYFAIRQDVKLLNEEIVRTAVDRTLPIVRARRGLAPSDVDWFLPHYSSEYFKKPLHDALAAANFPVGLDRWYSNLPEKGNTGAASIFIILEEFLRSGRLKKGEKVLLFVPESGRFSMSYSLATAV